MNNLRDKRDKARNDVWQAMRAFNQAFGKLLALYPGSAHEISVKTDHSGIGGYSLKFAKRKMGVWRDLWRQADPVSVMDIPCSEGYFELRQKYSASELVSYCDSIHRIRRIREANGRDNYGITQILDAMGSILSYACNRLENGVEDEWFDEYVTMFVPEPV